MNKPRKPEPDGTCATCEFYVATTDVWGACVSAELGKYIQDIGPLIEPDVRSDFGCVLWKEKKGE